MKLYHDPLSRSSRPLIMLEALAIPYEIELVSLRSGEHRSETHRARHPLMQLPVLEDDGLFIFESVAICMYLADRHTEAGLCPPPTAKERGCYYQWCCFVSGSLEPALARAYMEAQGQRAAPGTPAIGEALGVLSEALRAQDYLLSAGFSTADVLVGATLAILPRVGVELPPVLQAYVARLMTRSSFKKALG